MPLTFGNTGNLGGAVKAMCYAPAGYGKTMLCATAPRPLIISAENGLLSVKGASIPFIEVVSMVDFEQAYSFVAQSAEAKNFDTICIDSATDIAESALSEYAKGLKDPRQAYFKLSNAMARQLRLWRHLPNKHVYLTCKQAKIADASSGQLQYFPTMPGQVLPQSLPYWGDELLALRIISDDKGIPRRWLQTQPDISYYAKDRSGVLDFFEPPNLTAIFAKIQGEK